MAQKQAHTHTHQGSKKKKNNAEKLSRMLSRRKRRLCEMDCLSLENRKRDIAVALRLNILVWWGHSVSYDITDDISSQVKYMLSKL